MYVCRFHQYYWIYGQTEIHLWVHNSSTKALGFTEDNKCAKEYQGQRSYPEILLCSLSKQHLEEVFATCKETVTEEDLGAG